MGEVKLKFNTLIKGYIRMEQNKIEKTKQSEYWDSVLDPQNLSEDEEVPVNLLSELEFYEAPAQEFAYDLMGDIEGKSILEIGCGLGVNAIILAQEGAQVTGLDLSSRRLEAVSEIIMENEISGINLVCGSGETLPFPDESFDIVYTNAVMIHMDKPKAIKEIRRVLKPGGVAVMVEPMKYHPLANMYRILMAPRMWRTIADYITFKDLESFDNHFDSYGHKEFYFISFLSFYWQFIMRNLLLFHKSLMILQPIDSLLFRIIPPLGRVAWFTVYWGRRAR